ncbi:transporter substrate-binding domain-containing protein [Mesorhizobium sp. SB112]|uniref:transporter substrate-binding domain-containing protein n=1 Tax=Mesorhizobium sp. SB112 TaxID=3151853 RepID=UPI00326712C0
MSEPTPSTLRVGVYSSPPFVTKNSKNYSGMSIEIWERVAARLNVISEYQEFQNYSDLVTATANGTVDAAVTNLTITEGRAEVLDFTHPWFDAGLRVMVHKGSGSNFSDIIDDLGDAGHLMNYAWLGVMLVVATAALTLFDRRFDPEFPRRWREGLSESFYHVMSVATSGRTSRKNLFGWAGRIWQAIWMVFGIAVIAYVTSSVASVMTASHLTNQINSVADLQGKIVGVRSGSIAEEYMKGAFVNTMPFNHIEDATAALLNEEIAAIVGDKPVLEYHAHANPDLPVEVVGGTFHPDKYGFAFSTGSPFTRPASVAIIGLQESGEIEKLRVKYFGVQP